MLAVRVVNRDDLRLALDREGITETSSFVGGDQPERYCLGIVPGGWAVVKVDKLLATRVGVPVRSGMQ